jgi:PIN domain nuclease of toxin-antitoxin system
MTTILLDSHVVHWWSAEPERISPTAATAIAAADELAVSDISWFELAWLARHERIVLGVPLPNWLRQLAGLVRTIPVTPEIASAAVSLPASFPGDPADRLIYATAADRGWLLVTKDGRLRRHRHPQRITVW